MGSSRTHFNVKTLQVIDGQRMGRKINSIRNYVTSFHCKKNMYICIRPLFFISIKGRLKVVFFQVQKRN